MRVVSGVLCAFALLWGTAGNAFKWSGSAPCDNIKPIDESTADYRVIFDALNAKENAVHWVFRKAVLLRTAVGHEKPTAIRDCELSWPEDESMGDRVKYRRLSFQMNQAWKMQEVKMGVPVREWTEQHGFKYTYANYDNGANRELLGVEVCRRPEGCQALSFSTNPPVTAVAYAEPKECAKPRISTTGKVMTDAEFFKYIVSDLEQIRTDAWEERIHTGEYNQYGYPIYRIVKHPEESVDPLYRFGNHVLTNQPGEKAHFSYCKVQAAAGEDSSAREIDRRFYFARISDRGKIIDGKEYPNIHFSTLRVDVHAQCPDSTSCSTKNMVSYALCEGDGVCQSMGITRAMLGLDLNQFGKR